MHDPLSLKIQDRSGILLDTKARSVTAFNFKGNFDVLPGHSNLIALIERYIFYKDQQGKDHEFKLERAIMKVNSNKVSIFLSI